MRAGNRKLTMQPPRDGVITSLAARPGRSDRIAVWLNGVFAFDLAAHVADQAGLRNGSFLNVEAQERLRADDAPYLARSRALRLLALRDRSAQEVKVRLETCGFDQTVIAETSAWLHGLGYLDDERFAQRYAVEKRKLGWGHRRIRNELLSKGVDQTLVEAALGGVGVGSHVDEEGIEALQNLLRRRFGRQFASDPKGAERRVTGFLARRGYDWDTISRLLDEMRNDANAEGVFS